MSLKQTNKTRFFTLPTYIIFTGTLYLGGLLMWGILRMVLLCYTAEKSVRLNDYRTFKAFLIGFQFDTVMLAYILAFPIVCLFVQTFFNLQNKLLSRVVLVYLCIVFPFAVFLTIADIPYFNFFRNRLSESAMQWMGSSELVIQMVVQNKIHLLFLFLAILIMSGVVWLLNKYGRTLLFNTAWEEVRTPKERLYQIACFLCVGLLCFFGIRGKVAHPIRSGDAIFCDIPVLNQVGLNPVFTFIKSYSNKVKLMDEDVALQNTQQLLHIQSPLNSISPIAREVHSDSNMRKYNVILVLMEGMSANFMSTFGNQDHLTPTLDSLANVSWFFRNAYSAGIHTNNGIFSSLFSFPALKRVRPMSTVPVRSYSGLPFVFKQNGYSNYFLCTHVKEFDNIGNFIPQNNFDALVSADNLPADKSIGPFGVPDDYLFEKAIEKLNSLQKDQPFFTTILTASNHDPYILPNYFKSSISNQELKAVSYADWSIGQFLEKAKKTTWFNNTIFVFVADHGRVVGKNAYDLALSYNHIPVIMYAPSLLKNAMQIDNFIGQIDLFPTIMGILHSRYINNTLGIDVLHEKRDCIYFSADDKIGCMNDQWLYVYRFGGGESLYQYKTGSTIDYAKSHKTEFEFLRNYALSQTQAAELIISRDQTRIR